VAGGGRLVPEVSRPGDPRPPVRAQTVAVQPMRRRRDPSPSVWRYRFERLMRRGSVRFAARRLALPAVGLLVGAWAWGQEAIWASAEAALAEARRALVERPEFAVTRLEIEGGGDALRGIVEERVGFRAPISSLDLDLDGIRREVEAAPGVAEARVTVSAQGVLRVEVKERTPVALWRWEGQLLLVDAEGVVIAPVMRRADRPDLPLIIGEGADRAVEEALALHRRSAALRDRVRALVRVGERRWDVVLTGAGAKAYAEAEAEGAAIEEEMPDQRINLPSTGAEQALARALALNAAEDLLQREVIAVDLRNPDRPTLRLSPRAVAQLLRLRTIQEGEDA
jgi:cell division protein FtsQ